MHFSVLGQGTEWGYFLLLGVAEISNIFGGMLGIPDVSWG